MLWRIPEAAFQNLLAGSPPRDVLLVKARAGRGAILRELHEALGGAILGAGDFARDGAADEVFLRLMDQALANHPVVIVDDLHVVTKAANRNARAFLLDAALTALLGEASSLRRKLIFGTEAEAPWPLVRRAWRIELE